MDHIGIDVHKRESQIYILADGGEVIEQRIRIEPERFAAVLGPRARVLIEASTESEWLARCLEPSATRSSWPTRTSPPCMPPAPARSRPTGARLAPWRKRACSAPTAPPTASPIPSATCGARLLSAMPSVAAPLLALMRPLNRQLAYSDERIEHLAVQDPRVLRLRSVPSVGPVTAAAFLAAIDDAQRFRHAHQLEAYLGLVPREYSSGETQRRGPITKAGHSRTRWLLIQAAVSILRRRPSQAEDLRTWALRIAARRGKQVAIVALARRLAGILYALLRDGSVFEPQRVRPSRPAAAAS